MEDGDIESALDPRKESSESSESSERERERERERDLAWHLFFWSRSPLQDTDGLG